MSREKHAVRSAQEDTSLLTTQLEDLALCLPPAMHAFLLSHILIPFTLSRSGPPLHPMNWTSSGAVYAVGSVDPKQKSQEDLPEQSVGTQHLLYLSLCLTRMIAMFDGGIVHRFCEEPIRAWGPLKVIIHRGKRVIQVKTQRKSYFF